MNSETAQPNSSKAASRFQRANSIEWLAPAFILFCLLAIGRFYPPVEASPAQLVSQVRQQTEAGEFEAALTTLKTLLQMFPANHVYLMQASELSGRLENLEEQTAFLERYLIVSPSPGEACPALTHAYWQMKQTEKMLDSAKRCVALEPRNSDFRFDLALAYERSGQLPEALSKYEEGKNDFPGYTDFAIGHARILVRSDRAAEAWAEISPIIAEKPGLADAELVAALAAQKTGQVERAREILAAAIKAHPNYQELKDILKTLPPGEHP